MTNWKPTKLGEILTKSDEWVELKPEQAYRQVTVRLWGKGVTLRGEVTGAEIAASRQCVVHARQFIASRIDARNGAFGLIPDSLEGAIVTSDFPVFSLNHSRMLPEYLHWLSKTGGFVELCKAASEGTTNRVRLKEDRFLALEIPLPPVTEQRRIVARIEQLAAQIEETRQLRQESSEETSALLASEEMKIWPNESLRNAQTLESVTKFLARGRQSKQGESNHYLIKTQHVQMRKCLKTEFTLAPEIAAKVLPDAIARPGDILIACSAAGCLGRVARYMDSDRVASTDTHVAIARANAELILPEYLYAYLAGAQGQFQLRSRERGDWKREKISFRLTELNLSDLKQVPVPLPDKVEQQRIVDYLDGFAGQVMALTRLQSETAAELDALLPSILDKAFKGEL